MIDETPQTFENREPYECNHEPDGILWNSYNECWSCHRCGHRFHAPVAFTDEDYAKDPRALEFRRMKDNE